MRITEINRDFVEFYSGRSAQAPGLLAFPLGALALVSLLSRSGYTWERLTGSALLLITTGICAFRGQVRQRLQLRPATRQLRWQGRVISIASDAHLELDQSNPSHFDFACFPYEVRIVDGTGLRQLLLRSTLAPVLNDLRKLQEHWQIGVSLGSSLPNAVQKVLAEESELPLSSRWEGLLLVSPTQENQFGVASILLATSSLALVVVIFLMTGQLGRHGEIGALGVALGAMLIFVPLALAINLALGNIRVLLETNELQVERRRGIFGTRITNIPREDLEGVWLIQAGTGSVHELLVLRKSLFFSIPITGLAWPNWQVAVAQSNSSISSNV